MNNIEQEILQQIAIKQTIKNLSRKEIHWINRFYGQKITRETYITFVIYFFVFTTESE